MRGAKPKPTRLKIITGNPGNRKLNHDEPKPPVAKVLRAPRALNPVGRQEFKRVGKQLAELGLLTEVDHRALALYADVYSQWVHATERVHETGMIIKAPSGFPIHNPYLGIANKASRHMLTLLAEFGMTPSSRTRVTAPPTTNDEFDDL